MAAGKKTERETIGFPYFIGGLRRRPQRRGRVPWPCVTTYGRRVVALFSSRVLRYIGVLHTLYPVRFDVRLTGRCACRS